ncbi:hypothetical protein GCM10027346_23150 [Hymenobacter seoulensis]
MSLFTLRSTALLVSLLILAPTGRSRAQTATALPATLKYATYTWEARRKPIAISAAEGQQGAVVLRDFRVEEFAADQKDQLHLYSLDHRIVRVNTSDGIERFNKIYLPIQDGGRIVSLKARTISPRGEIVEVSDANMKELKDEDGGRGFKVFAVEGVEKGSEIEYLFTRERPMTYFGRIYVQNEVPTREMEVELISPEALTFEMHRYPGGLVRDTLLGGKHLTRVALHNVPALREEGFAAVQANRQRLEYKLAYSAAQGEARLFTWAEASKFIYAQNYKLDKDEAKVLDKLVKQMNLPSVGTLPALENYIKTNFRLADDADMSLTRIIASRTASERGFTRLFAVLLTRFNLTHELVLTSDRNEVAFDEAFDTWNALDHAVFYFPATKQWLAPGRTDYRLPLIPAEWTANKGLFVRTVKLGTTENAVGRIGEIPTLTAEQSPNDLGITIQFAPNLDKSIVTIRETLGGYNALQIQPFYLLIPEDKRTEILQNLIKSNVPDATFQKLTVTNTEVGINPIDKPFIVDATVESVALLDRAGPKYLFKIGTLLGPQSELYQANERQFDVENEFNRQYNRTITFEVPAGYQVRNLNDLNFNVTAGPTAKEPEFLFKSGYQQQGQKVTITIEEYYRQIRWPKSDFEAFRGVVNAAANFNKVVLVLEKKS